MFLCTTYGMLHIYCISTLIYVINPLSQMIYYHVFDMLAMSIWFISVYLSDLQT